MASNTTLLSLLLLLVCVCSSAAYVLSRDELINDIDELDDFDTATSFDDENESFAHTFAPQKLEQKDPEQPGEDEDEQEKDDPIDINVNINVEKPIDGNNVSIKINGKEKEHEYELIDPSVGSAAPKNPEQESAEKPKEENEQDKDINITVNINVNQPEEGNGNIKSKGKEKEESGSDVGEYISKINERSHVEEKVGKEPGVTLQGGDELISDSLKEIQVFLNNHPGNQALQRDFAKYVDWSKKGDVVDIPYVVDPAVASYASDAINQAVQEFKQKTCINWVKVEPGFQIHHVKIIKGDGCSSYVGRFDTGKGYQPLSIDRGCHKKGIVEHEMMHALGFFHEQNRPDRDRYVKIYWENIMKGWENNFKKQQAAYIDYFGLPYDFGSLMQYGSHYAAIKKWWGLKQTDSMLKVNGDHITGQRDGFSALDIKAINAAYKCNGKTVV